ncbi:hypothetical protein GCM10022242_11590 [Nocardioides panacisoli]|uniref:Uncharacterized protein n=1 Tax=Nocardioides panacisoli TaxID=627624 RepID=A0ABP7I6A0_9ACTN
MVERAGALFVVLRERELVVFLAPLDELRLEDVVRLRDPGGEDVRVAMVNNLPTDHTSHRHHTSVSPARLSRPLTRGTDHS